jgi:DNA gyrase subunit A
MQALRPGSTILTVCEHGYGKRTNFEEYRVQSRGGKGLINIRTTGRNGKVVAARSAADGDELMLITEGGMICRIGVAEVRTIGRATQGVRLIQLREGDRLVAVARVAREEEGPVPPEAGAAPE